MNFCATINQLRPGVNRITNIAAVPRATPIGTAMINKIAIDKNKNRIMAYFHLFFPLPPDFHPNEQYALQ